MFYNIHSISAKRNPVSANSCNSRFCGLKPIFTVLTKAVDNPVNNFIVMI